MFFNQFASTRIPLGASVFVSLLFIWACLALGVAPARAGEYEITDQYWAVDFHPSVTYGDGSTFNSVTMRLFSTSSKSIPPTPEYSTIVSDADCITATATVKYEWTGGGSLPSSVVLPWTTTLTGTITGSGAALGGVENQISNYSRGGSGLNVTYAAPLSDDEDMILPSPAPEFNFTIENCYTFTGASCYYQGPGINSTVTANSSAQIIFKTPYGI